MKITYAVPRYLPHLGGIENHVAALATLAAREGHEVDVLTQLEGTAAPAHEVIDGVTVKRFPSALSTRGQGLSPALWRSVRDLDDSNDILHIHNVHGASTLGVLAAARSGPIVVTPHYLGTGEGRLNRALHRAYDPWLGRALRRASAIICVSRAEADELVQDLGVAGERIKVIPNGVDLVAMRSVAPAEASGRVVFVAGRLEQYKQAVLAVKAVPFLPPDYQLVIAGAGPEEAMLRAAAESGGVCDRVRLVGKLDSSEMARWYQRAEVVVSMSRRECFGMTLAEGFAARCAVVASDIPAHREVIENAGCDRRALISLDSTARELAGAIVEASNAQGGREPRIASWDDVVSDTIALYRSLQASTATTR